MEQEVTMIFADGTELKAMLNASTYITDEKPDFPNDLTVVTVKGEDGTNVYHNVEFMEAYSDDGRYWFGIKEVSPELIAQEKMDAQVMFTALMTDTLIEED